MEECLNFSMQIKKKIPEVIEFVTEKLVKDELKAYCSGNDKYKSEHFSWWCKDASIDKAKGIVTVMSDVQIIYDWFFDVEEFVEDIAKNIPDAEFSGDIYHSCDDYGIDQSSEFKMKKGKLTFTDTTPHMTYGYGYDEYDEEEDYDEDEEE